MKYECLRCKAQENTTNPPHLCKDVKARLSMYRNERRQHLRSLLRGRRCPKHPTKRVQRVCGTAQCGLCYEQFLLTAPDRNAERKTGNPDPDYFKPHGFSGHGQKARV
jgi:hypothetical protein